MRSQRNTPTSARTVAIVVVAVVIVALIVAGVALTLLSRTQTGSGHLVTNQEVFTGFTSVAVANGFRFTITQSSSYSVNVTVDDNLVNDLRISESGNVLTIGLAPGYLYLSASPKVQITMPDIAQLDLSGGSSGTAQRFNSSHDFTVTASGGSSITMNGGARNLSIEGSGGSQLDLSNFHVANAQVDLSGGSGATINLTGRLDASLSGGSHLSYIGNPTMGNITASDFSIISKK
jgi:putative autotransporter adhesin-like protein